MDATARDHVITTVLACVAHFGSGRGYRNSNSISHIDDPPKNRGEQHIRLKARRHSPSQKQADHGKPGKIYDSCKTIVWAVIIMPVCSFNFLATHHHTTEHNGGERGLKQEAQHLVPARWGATGRRREKF